MNSLLKTVEVLVLDRSTMSPLATTTTFSLVSEEETSEMFTVVVLPGSRSTGPTSTRAYCTISATTRKSFLGGRAAKR